LQKVSIIIPCWNAEAFIADAINSALAQSYLNKEIIVVDDGSADKSLRVIESFGDKVTTISIKNSGAGVARNIGFSASSGEWVKFLDADDYLLPGCVEKQVIEALKLSDKEFPVGRAYRLIETTGVIFPNSSRDSLLNRQESLSDIVMDVPIIAAPLYRRNTLEKIGCFDEALPIRQDFDLFIRVLLSGDQPIMTPEPVCVWRDHVNEERVSNLNSLNKAEQQYAMYEKLINILAALEPNKRKYEIEDGLAVSIWATGRRVLRQGNEELSRDFFSLAKACSHRKNVSGQSLYRLVNRMFGPIVAESLLDTLKSSLEKLRRKPL